MFVRLLILFLGISIVQVDYIYANKKVGGWQTSGSDSSETEMLNLAEQQLKATYNLTSESIQVLSYETQIVSGTNYRLIFIVNEQQKCTLQVYKPLPFTKRPNQVSFQCDQ